MIVEIMKKNGIENIATSDSDFVRKLACIPSSLRKG